MDIRYELSRQREKAYLWFIWKLPRRWVYWCVIRAVSHATTGQYGKDSPTSITFDTVLKRWEVKP